MKRFFIHILVIWASCLILPPQPGEAEMKALSETQMGDSYFETWNFSLTADRETKGRTEAEGEAEKDVLLDETEEDRLGAHQQDRTASGLIGNSRIDPGPVEESNITKYGRWERVESGGGFNYTPRPSAHITPWSEPLH